jgi:hypothetical protein
MIEIADHRDIGCIGSPYRKVISTLAKHFPLMRAEKFVEAIMGASLKIFDILLRKQRIVPYRFRTINKMNILVSLLPFILFCTIAVVHLYKFMLSGYGFLRKMLPSVVKH